jgi:hypothetical protein
VSIGAAQAVGDVQIFGRTDRYGDRINGLTVRIGNDAAHVKNNAACYSLQQTKLRGSCNGKTGRFLSVDGATEHLTLCGVTVAKPTTVAERLGEALGTWGGAGRRAGGGFLRTSGDSHMIIEC